MEYPDLSRFYQENAHEEQRSDAYLLVFIIYQRRRRGR